MRNFIGLYGGVAEEVNDPEHLGRVKVRVPEIFGTAADIPTDSLPWALPRGLPFGNSQDSGGISWLPAKGDTLWVMFLDGDPEKPVWEWAMAPTAKAQQNKLHQYSDIDKSPKRAALTRYGHVVEFNSTGIILTTKDGDSVILDNGNHVVQVQNQSKYIVRVDQEEITLKAGSNYIKVDKLGNQVNVVTKDINLSGIGDIHVKGKSFGVSTIANVDIKSKADITIDGLASVSITSKGEVSVKVGVNEILMDDESMVLSSGGMALEISPSGFEFR